MEALESEGPMPTIAPDIVLDAIEQAVNDAVVEFTEAQTDLQQKFFDTLTHDLRTPLAVARMNAQITLKRSDLAGPAIAAQNNILTSLNRLDSMMQTCWTGAGFAWANASGSNSRIATSQWKSQQSPPLQWACVFERSCELPRSEEVRRPSGI